ncbi:MAG: hypothetical protein AAF993_04670 [Pseudomonadota bacterium]
MAAGHADQATPGWLSDPALFHALPVPQTRIDPVHIPWVDLAESMTAAIATRFGAAPTVQVHYSGTAELFAWESNLLQLPPSKVKPDVGFARQISLMIPSAQETNSPDPVSALDPEPGTALFPVLAARSVTCCPDIEAELTGLHQTPLARRLFESSDWQRHGEAQPLRQGSLTGRACQWRFQPTGKFLLVEEFFLADLSSSA